MKEKGAELKDRWGTTAKTWKATTAKEGKHDVEGKAAKLRKGKGTAFRGR
jgi:hypothetical protein